MRGRVGGPLSSEKTAQPLRPHTTKHATHVHTCHATFECRSLHLELNIPPLHFETMTLQLMMHTTSQTPSAHAQIVVFIVFVFYNENQKKKMGRPKRSMASLEEGQTAVCVLVNCASGAFLSCASAPFDRVDLFPKNDGSGRQMWLMHDLDDGSSCTIKVFGGRGNDTRLYLSASEHGAAVSLVAADSHSGLQMFFVDDLHGDGSECLVRVAGGREVGKGCVLSRIGDKEVGLTDRCLGPDQKWRVMRVAEADLPKAAPPHAGPEHHPPPTAPEGTPALVSDVVSLDDIEAAVHNVQPVLHNIYTRWEGPDGRTYLVNRKDDQRVLDLLVALNKFGVGLTEHARSKHGDHDRFVRRLSHMFETSISHIGDLSPEQWAAGICWCGSDPRVWIGMLLAPTDAWSWSVYYFCHEIAHALGSWSHGPTFYESFRWCLRTAYDAGLWDPNLGMAWAWSQRQVHTAVSTPMPTKITKPFSTR